MAILRSPVQFAERLDPLNAPRPLTVGDELLTELALPMADRTAADVDGSGQGVIVRANAVGAVLAEQLVDYDNYEFTFASWQIGNNDLKTLTLSQYCNLIMIAGFMGTLPEQYAWCTSSGSGMGNYDAEENHWLTIRAKTLYFKRHDFSQMTMLGLWGFY